MKKLAAHLLLVLAIASPHAAGAQGQTNCLDKVYADESHCLVGPEIRSDRDNPISCYCRDAIVDARYVYFTYLLQGKTETLTEHF